MPELTNFSSIDFDDKDKSFQSALGNLVPVPFAVHFIRSSDTNNIILCVHSISLIIDINMSPDKMFFNFSVFTFACSPFFLYRSMIAAAHVRRRVPVRSLLTRNSRRRKRVIDFHFCKYKIINMYVCHDYIIFVTKS